MKTISELGNNRLCRILAGDKNQSPERLCALVKSDIKMLLNNYAELDGDVEVELCSDGQQFLFVITCKANRMKTLGIIP
jgi:hypothetical protein